MYVTKEFQALPMSPWTPDQRDSGLGSVSFTISRVSILITEIRVGMMMKLEEEIEISVLEFYFIYNAYKTTLVHVSGWRRS